MLLDQSCESALITKPATHDSECAQLCRVCGDRGVPTQRVGIVRPCKGGEQEHAERRTRPRSQRRRDHDRRLFCSKEQSCKIGLPQKLRSRRYKVVLRCNALLSRRQIWTANRRWRATTSSTQSWMASVTKVIKIISNMRSDAMASALVMMHGSMHARVGQERSERGKCSPYRSTSLHLCACTCFQNTMAHWCTARCDLGRHCQLTAQGTCTLSGNAWVASSTSGSSLEVLGATLSWACITRRKSQFGTLALENALVVVLES